MAGTDLATFLAGVAPFDALDDAELSTAVDAARIEDLAPGDVVTTGLVRRRRRCTWWSTARSTCGTTSNAAPGPADERLGAGGVFSTRGGARGAVARPHAVAVGAATVAAIPVTLVASAFASRRGAAFLAEHVSSAQRRPVAGPRYTLVDELIVRPPLVVEGSATRGRGRGPDDGGRCRLRGRALAGGGFGLVTDDLLRRRLIVDGCPPRRRCRCWPPSRRRPPSSATPRRKP